MKLSSLLAFLPGARLPDVRVDPRDLPQPDISSSEARDRFFEWTQDVPPTSSVLEVGTRQNRAGESHSRCEFPLVPRENYVMVDVEDGIDVDIVADLHALPASWNDRFDAFVAIAVFEHLERPWIAAKEVARVLKPGGRCFVSTHQTYPLHGYPADFFRFSREALRLIFEDAGIRVLHVAYQHRAQIIAPKHIMAPQNREHWNKVWPSYLCVDLHGEKP